MVFRQMVFLDSLRTAATLANVTGVATKTPFISEHTNKINTSKHEQTHKNTQKEVRYQNLPLMLPKPTSYLLQARL